MCTILYSKLYQCTALLKQGDVVYFIVIYLYMIGLGSNGIHVTTWIQNLVTN